MKILGYFFLSLGCFFGTHAWFGLHPPIVDFSPPLFYFFNMFSIFGALTLFVLYFKNSQREYRKKLEKKNEELKRISYSLSHELKSPLRGISSLVHFVREDNQKNLNAESGEHFEAIVSRVERIDGLVDAIQQYFRSTSENEEKRTFKPTEVVRNFSEKWKNDSQLSLSIQESAIKTNSFLSSYEVVIRQLMNLSHAFNDKEKKEIRVEFKENHGFFETHISDNGPGFSPAEKERLFNFFMGGSLSEMEKLPALGLAVVKKIVDGNGGKITVESQPGIGSTFAFSWPLR